MAGQYRFKDTSGNVVAQISASADGTISFSGSTANFSQVNSVNLGSTTITGTATNSNAVGGYSSSAFVFTSSFNTISSSVSSDLLNLKSKSSSVDISITNINSFTASNANTSLNLLTGSLATTGSNTFKGTTIISGSTYIQGDLVVYGSSSIQYISASSVNIGTNIVQLNTANPAVRFAGLTMIDSGSVGGSGSFLYDSNEDEFIFVHRGNGTNVTSSHFVMGPETYDSLGNETYLTNNRLIKGTGKEHLVDSCIWELSGSVGINTTTTTNLFKVSGALSASIGTSQAIYFNPSLIASASNDVLLGLDVIPTFTCVGYTGVSSLTARFSGSVVVGTIPSNISAFTYPPLTLSNNAQSATRVQLALVNGGGLCGAASAIDFFTYTDQGNSCPGVRLISSDDGNFSGNFQIQTKATGSAGTGALSTKLMIIGATGNVGVGTSTVGSKLQVCGNAAIGYGTSKAAPTNGLAVAGYITGGQYGGSANSIVNLDMSNQGGWPAARFLYPCGGKSSLMEVAGSGIGINDIWFQGLPATTAGYTILMDYNGAGLYISTAGTGTPKPIIFNIFSSEKMRIDGCGNVGIGSTPSLWSNGTENALQIKNASIYEYGAYEMGLQVNAFYNTSVAPSGWKYISSGIQCIGQLQLSGGDLNYNVANPGCTGCSITWNTKFNITRTGCVGIGTSSPSYRLEICGDGTGIGELAVKGTGTDIGLALNNTGTGGKAWRILSTGGGSGAGNGKLVTWDGTGYGWVMDCSRNMGIGTTSPGATLHVGGTTGDRAIFICSSCKTSNPAYLRLIGINSNDATTQFQIVHRGNHSNAGYTDRIDFGVNNGTSWCERVIRLDFNGNVGMCEGSLSVVGGVKFGNGSGTLNYYEEGTWTPRLMNGAWTSNAGASNVGWYTRIGNLVTVGGTIDWGGGSGSQSSNLIITCLPFTSNSTSNTRNVGQIGAPAPNSIAYICSGKGQFVIVNDPNQSSMYIIETFQNGAYATYTHGPTVANAGTIYGFQLTYHI